MKNFLKYLIVIPLLVMIGKAAHEPHPHDRHPGIPGLFVVPALCDLIKTDTLQDIAKECPNRTSSFDDSVSIHQEHSQ